MATISNLIFQILVFFSVYVQVFLFVTFLENKKKIIRREGPITLKNYPSVTVIVPCWNEERTIAKTVESLHLINYPKDKLKILLVDDGSTDGTWEIMQRFSNHPNVQIFRKKNGGKYTALNLGLANTKTEFLACLDADSIAGVESLVRLMSYFENDPTTMAVAPSVIVNNPRNIIESAQKCEYYMSVYIKKMLGFMGAIHVTPGPLTVFRKKVFDDLGSYRHAHNTEDMEIAYRMQKNHYKIEQCNDAYVYTNTPKTARALYKQRSRWIYGFINNTIDYRHILFNRKYGNFSTFTVPAAIFSILSVAYLLSRIIYNFSNFIYHKFIVLKINGVGGLIPSHHLDLFFVNTQSLFFVIIFIYTFVFMSITVGRRMAEGKWSISLDTVYFFSVFGLIAPFWLLKAVYNTITARAPSWR